ncbi:hypothetical protein IJG04_01175 [Candidatus Saccharibacteria bacterium]|nr:hypothetical protein [Candidatus Saccharibacteria bacterium]
MKKPRWAIKEKIKRKKLKVKTWWLVVLLIPLGFIDVTLLRNNHIHMTELRDAVMTADVAEDDEKIEQGLMALKEYVFSDIVINVVEENGAQKVTFGTGPFYLEHQYIRAANEALEKAEANLGSDANPYGNIYNEASGVCRTQAIANGWSWDNANYINCMLTEIEKYPASDNLQSQMMAELPSTELYRHNYASPVWAPTWTGFVLLFTLVVIVVIFIRLIIWVVLRLSLLFL